MRRTCKHDGSGKCTPRPRYNSSQQSAFNHACEHANEVHGLLRMSHRSSVLIAPQCCEQPLQLLAPEQ